MDNRTNTIAGWALGGAGIALALSIVGGMAFEGRRPEKMGYPIEGVADDSGGGAAAEVPIASLLPTADATKGADVFKKCAACHNVAQGGAAGVGPNLYGVVGDAIGQGRGFQFSDALGKIGGKWDFDKLNAWLTSPRKFAPGTKMTFAGLGSAQDRANVILYLNQQGSNLPLPPPSAAGATAAKPDGAAATAGANPAKGTTAAGAAAIKAATTGSPTADMGNMGTPASGAPSVDPAATTRGALAKGSGK
ncbi:c-type cytochrome [uncultured Sphingomonas sp.]|uniref:c-type cytochrome n=1 Tax=uncultured Sphingomonas sp. TaxID=158754 RepID=UPI0035CA87A3